MMPINALIPPPEGTNVYMEWARVLVLWLFTLGGAAYTGWKTSQRRERARVGVYSGAPDSAVRILTRKQWHDVADKVQNHVWKWDALERENKRRDAEYVALRGDVDRLLQENAQAMADFARLDERVTNSLKQWEGAEERAAEDRRETNRRIDAFTAAVEALRQELRRATAAPRPTSERS